MDDGDVEGAADLFRHAKIEKGFGVLLDDKDLRDYWKRVVIIYSDGTPKTKHIVTNPIIEIDADSATCRSYYTVIQSLPDFPPQIVAAGRYHDRFERVGGAWRFSYRNYNLREFSGDLSRHIRQDARDAFAEGKRRHTATRE